MSTSAATFETERLALFREHGFDAKPRFFRDAEGRPTYAMVREGEGVPLVLVHGGLSEASVWFALAGKLSGHVVLVDRPGCGLSFGVDYTRVDYQRAASDWMRSVADALGAERVDIVGNSMGGYFGMAFALAHPSRVQHLVLPGAPAGLDRPLPPYLRLLATPLAHVLQRMRIDDPEVMRTRVLSTLVAHPERVPVRAIEVAMMNARMPASKLCVRTMLANVSDLGGWRRSMLLRDALAELDVPTLFLWGNEDTFAPPSSGLDLAARMPRAEARVLDDCGHLPQIDQPDLVAAEIERFTQRARRSASQR